MDLSEHPLRTPASLEELSAPGADDRWQPTRAGAVNSWAWADELFLFGDGWLAFAGPNGSGKSLTASMLITVLLDADTSQTALSTDEKAAGTLTSRHTDRNDHEDRTGSWWLEYGFRDGQTGQVDYLTTGLWLRSTSSGIQRAYFITPGRVGPDLLLQRGQEPVRVEDLAEQLATIGGDLYTNSDKVGRKAAKFLSLSGEEGDYRAAVRTRLFTGLDEVQFAALMSVLRSLRSLRTGERISPDKMRTVLTEALPALDEDGLKMIAESMERIAKHESDLERTHQEAEALAGVESRYTRYVQLVAQIEAADLQSSNREFDQMTRQTRSFTDKLATAVAVQERAREEQAANNKDLAELDGRLDGIESELRGHAGNALPERERLASSLAEQAEAATERAEQARAAAEHAGERAADSNASAEDGCSHLDGLGRELRRGGTALGAEAALDQLLAASTRVAESRPGKDLVHSIELVTDLPREQLVEPSTPRLDADAARLLTQIPKAWAEDRQRRITGVREALGHHANARSALHEASTALREAEEQEELGLQEAEATQQRRYDLEATLIQGIERWQEALQQLAPAAGPLPTSGTSPGDGDDRLQLHSVTRWVEAALSDALIRIDEPGHQQVATTSRAEAMHTAAAAATATARNQRAEADHQRAAADRTALGASQNLQADVDEQSRRAADEAHDVVLAEAEGEVAIATDAFTLSVSTADREARSWTSQLGAWLAGLSQLQLPPTELNLYKGGPDSAAPDAILTDLDHLEPALLVQAVDTAHRAVADPIRIRIVKTRPQAEQSAAALRDLEDRLAQVLAEVPAPPGPEWRDRDHTQAIPLWQTVDFAADVPEEIADRVEGALLVSGLLDALITADGQLVAGDLTITAADSAVSPSLADVLVIAADYLDDNGSDAGPGRADLGGYPDQRSRRRSAQRHPDNRASDGCSPRRLPCCLHRAGSASTGPGSPRRETARQHRRSLRPLRRARTHPRGIAKRRADSQQRA
ncbi:hypothetical protein [Kribbella qitaiheensis]|uniref:hypothetical protein n=1 Tax=Kribbella qitaiheensis TaxID=1544730 RepID=UPI0016295F54|nr:hypothetical protein [Kribbella qitaiheensis]